MALVADFHNHSCLSPCGSLDLSPGVLAELAAARGVEVLALTDHNSSLNCPAFAKHCARLGLIPLFGMEAASQEEVHVLCLFSKLEAAMEFSSYAYSLLPQFPNDPDRTGDQVYVDEDDNIEGEVEYYLVNALDISLDDLGAVTGKYGGITIPAHVDRPAFSMTSQLGVVVPGPWAAVECVRLPPQIDTLGYPLTTSSDAHYPEHVARRPFELDISREELLPHGPGGEADMDAFVRALSRRPKS
ncbi:PHP domain-containing protein [Breznakiella homolactica]|uniref:PHP domain-containing protein n=1 Tax=Breznakiella homolactica TaxID=2798577 RepID=A0A7T8BAI2_9SPIR|nr:PHP domain-containing protein [Breznakiella homolactica]QQO09396.1 PHP domain-containing protein [Breznakiella homolactica]